MTSKPIVVVIEDDLASADALRLILADWGAEVVFATTAPAAFEQLGPRARTVKWIITDFNLGQPLDGVAALCPLLPNTDGARVLVLSGSFAGRAAKAAAAAGFDSMAKPANAQEIVTWLEAR